MEKNPYESPQSHERLPTVDPGYWLLTRMGAVGLGGMCLLAVILVLLAVYTNRPSYAAAPADGATEKAVGFALLGLGFLSALLFLASGIGLLFLAFRRS